MIGLSVDEVDIGTMDEVALAPDNVVDAVELGVERGSAVHGAIIKTATAAKLAT